MNGLLKGTVQVKRDRLWFSGEGLKFKFKPPITKEHNVERVC